MIHNILPVGAKTQRYGPKYSPTCPTCCSPLETQLHLFHCNSPSRTAWRSQFTNTLRATAKKLNLQEILIKIMVDGCLSFLRNQQPINPTDYPYRFRRLISQQNQIGWLNFLRGRWSKEWAKRQHIFSHHKKQAKQSQNISRNWVPTMIRANWDSVFEMWEQRNTDLHGSNSDTRKQARRHTCLRELRHAYATRFNQPYYKQHLFNLPLATLEQSDNYAIQNWLALWQPVLEDDNDDSSTEESLG